MSRLSGLHREGLDDASLAVWDSITSSRGATVVGTDGSLVGPFNAWVHAPEVGARLTELGAVLRFGSVIERRLLELAIITVGARWEAEFEWWAHARMAREHGISDAVIDAVGHGGPVGFERDDERVVHAVASELAGGGRLGESTYAAAVELLGEKGMVELVSLCGYYTLVSFALNAFEVPLPPGVEPRWRKMEILRIPLTLCPLDLGESEITLP